MTTIIFQVVLYCCGVDNTDMAGKVAGVIKSVEQELVQPGDVRAKLHWLEPGGRTERRNGGSWYEYEQCA